MEVKSVPIDRVIPYARNPRKNEAAVAKVAASLREFGWRQPIVVDDEMVVIAGHTRLQAARTLGMAQVPVHVATGLSKSQAKAYRLADNRTGEEADWDLDMLRLEFNDLQEDSFDLGLTGFDASELKRALFEEELNEAAARPVLGDSLKYQIVIDCTDEMQQADLLGEFEAKGLKCRPLTL